MADDPLAFAREMLDTLAADGLHRTPLVVDSGPGPVIELAGERLLNFCSNNYLGLAEHPALAVAASEAARRWGTGATASRLVVGTSALIEELECRLASWRGAESAVVFPTGYQMNLGTVGALVGRADLAVADKLCHASLIDAARLSGAKLRTFPHGDLGRLEKLLRSRSHGARALVLTDGIFSMDGDICDLPALAEITGRHGALLLVDDAHALGVLGKSGGGTSEHFGLNSVPHLIQTATLSKALGSQGGVVTGPRTLIGLLVNRARTFIYTTGLAPPAAAAALAAVEVLRRESDRCRRLWANRERLAAGLTQRGWHLCGSQSPILPLLAGSARDALALAARLRLGGVLAVAIRPPTVPRSRCRVRLTVMATHTEEQIDHLLEVVGSPRGGGVPSQGSRIALPEL